MRASSPGSRRSRRTWTPAPACPHPPPAAPPRCGPSWSAGATGAAPPGPVPSPLTSSTAAAEPPGRMEPMRPLVIIGAGGHAREIVDIVEAVNALRPTFDLLGLLVDGLVAEDRLARRALRILGPTSALSEQDADYIIGIGDPTARRRFDEVASAAGKLAATLV